jgi:hypothetical protein
MRADPIIALLALSASACSSGLDDTTSLGVSNLEQHVSISPASPVVGDVLTVRSVIVNRGSSPAVVDHYSSENLRLSGIAFSGSNTDTLPGLGWTSTVETTLTPGDSIVATRATNPIASKAGDYLFFVQHVSSPAVGVTVHLKVKTARTPR